MKRLTHGNHNQKLLTHTEIRRWQPYDQDTWFEQGIWLVRYKVDMSTGDVLEALVAPNNVSAKEAKSNHGHYWFSQKDQCWKFKLNKIKSKDPNVIRRLQELKEDASYAGFIAKTAKNANF